MMAANNTHGDNDAQGWLQKNDVHILTGVFFFTLLTFTLLGVLCLRKYRSLVRTVRELEASKFVLRPVPRQEAPVMPAREATAAEKEHEELPLRTPLQQRSTVRCSSRRLWKGLQQVPRFTKSDLNLLQLIKAGKEGAFYQARMTRGTCKGHNMFTCKISKEGWKHRHFFEGSF